MAELESLLHRDEAILVLGSLIRNRQDGYLDRSEIRPMQVLIDGMLQPVSFFDSWGDMGVSSLAWHPGDHSVLYVTTGDELVRIDLGQRSVSGVTIPDLRDVHEMTIIEDTLWLANTGLDEIVAFDISREKVSDRIRLNAYSSRFRNVSRATAEDCDEFEVVERFHCNQVFEGFDGDLYALVHHVTGKQLIRRIAEKLIKSQGNGGVINLSTGRTVPLRLRAPHSVRKVRGRYWLCDSGNATVNVYSPDWELKDTLRAKGWGRGADISEALGIFYLGISATRRRYLNVVLSGRKVPNTVQAFSVEDRSPVGEVEFSAIEQINNVYTIPREVAVALLDLRSAGAVR